jgi:TonB family protein
MIAAVISLVMAGAPNTAGPVAEAASEQMFLGELQESQGLKRNSVVVPNDYPARALRNGIEGTVTLLLLIAPNGRVAYSSVVGPADPMLAQAAQEAATRRVRGLHFKGHEGKYVWVRLPTVQFRFGDCGGELAKTPALPGAIVVTRECVVTSMGPPITDPSLLGPY